MRLNKQQIEYMAFYVAKNLIANGLVIAEDKEKFVQDIQNIITNELLKEDELDEKVKEILSQKIDEIRNSNIDYFEMFKMVKAKLAEKEGIIL